MKVKSESEVAQSCPTPSDPMDCSPSGPSVHGIFEARVLEWVAIAFSGQGLCRAFKIQFNSVVIIPYFYTILKVTFPLQYSCLENPMDGGAWQAAVHAVAKSRTRLSDFAFTFHFHALEKEMATHSSVLAWRIPGLGKAGGLPSMGLHRVGHD